MATTEKSAKDLSEDRFNLCGACKCGSAFKTSCLVSANIWVEPEKKLPKDRECFLLELSQQLRELPQENASYRLKQHRQMISEKPKNHANNSWLLSNVRLE